MIRSMNTTRYNPAVIAAGNFPYADFLARKKELLDEGKRIFDFSIGDPLDPTPENIRRHLAKSIPVISQYPEVRGYKTLRQEISGYLSRRFSVSLDPENEILVNSGSKEAIFHFPLLFSQNTQKRNFIIFGIPGYFVYERGALLSGFTPYPVNLLPENKYLLNLEKIPSEVLAKTSIVWLNYPHNPTGAVCTRSYLEKQVAICKEHGIILCSDETYIDLYFKDPQPTILELARENVVAFHSCSKRSGMTGYRSGFMAGDGEILKHYASLRNSVGTAPSEITQIAASEAWGDDQHASERRKLFQAKKNLFMEFLDRHKFEVEPPEATFYLWVRAPGGSSAYDYCRAMLEKGFIFSPGDFYGEKDSSYFRIALAPAIAECTLAIAEWANLL